MLEFNKKEVLAAIEKNNASILRYINGGIQYVYILELVSEELKNDKEIILAAVKKHGFALKYASEKLKDDKEVVLAAVNQSSSALIDKDSALEHASERLKDDKEVVLAAVKKRGSALKYASERLKDDKEVVLVALKEKGSALEHASEKLKNDKEVVLVALNEKGSALEYASEKLKDDKEVVLVAVKKHGYALKYASERLKDDKEVVLAGIENDARTIAHASEKLKNDKNFIIKTIQIKPNILHYIDAKIRDDKEFEIYKSLNLDFLEKLKKIYYAQYQKKVISKDETKDNIIDFYKTMLMSNVLENIYSSTDYSISDTRSIESSISIFNEKEQEFLLKKIKFLVEKNRDYFIKFSNQLIGCNGQKEKMDELLKSNNFNKDTIVQFILKNKYFDKLRKTSLLNVVFQIYDASKIIKVSDIFEILDEMESRNLTIDEILKEKEIDKKLFYTIYETAKSNNPMLFNHIKDSLNQNKIQGFKKFITKGYIVLNSKLETLDEYQEKYNINIYDFIKQYQETELYDKLLSKFSMIEGFDLAFQDERLEIQDEKTYK